MGRIRVVLDRLGPRPQTARRFAPAIETPLRAYGARRRVPIGRYLFVKGENPPFHTFPRTRRQRTEFAAICFFRAQLTAAHTRWCRRQGNADLRSASRGSAKPAPTTLRPANLTAARTHASPTAQNHGEHGAPVSDRHRAGARNPPQHTAPRQSHGCKPTHRQPRRSAPRQSPVQTHASRSVERRSPTGIARERETRPNDPTPRQSHGWSAGLRPASRGSAKPAPTTPLPTLTRVPPPAARFPGC